ncbi:ATP-binding protein, partial [Actinomadura sp. NPDC048032]|uniref:ATP-binding protein n=1 Tax=Actinomadura sp. NPDC048032 TaxID=3155747 RepID=UPI0033C9C3EB
ALTGGPEGDTLIRRAARVAARTKGADLLAVHVLPGDGLTGADPAHLVRQRALVENLGGTYHQVVGDDVPSALLDFARGVNATQLVLGASRRGRVAQLFSRGVGVTTTAHSGPIDVHLVTHEEVSKGRRARPSRGGLTRRRRTAGFAMAAALLPLLTLVLHHLQGEFSLPSDILLFLVLVIGVALVGGLYPALFTAVFGSLLLNFYFTPPLNRFTISERENLLALVVYVVVAAAVSAVVDLNYRRSREAARTRTEAEVLSALAGGVLRGQSTPRDILEDLRQTFGLTAVTLLEREPESAGTLGSQGDPDRWRIVSTAGGPPCTAPKAGETGIPIDDGLVLVLRGRTLRAEDRRVVEAFAAHAAAALQQQRLTAEAERARPLAEADRVRTALLNAVGHDLRTPLSSAKAAVDSLRSPDVTWIEEDRDELVDTAAESLARLDRLVTDLLDMSRLQAGVLGVVARPLAVEDVVPRAVASLDHPGAAGVRIRISGGLPEVPADPVLLQRVLANLVANAVRHNPPGERVTVTASAHADRVELRVIDRGPGIPASERDAVFAPFQRLDDRGDGAGVGLGLALARGMTEAMGGTLLPEETPGGGLTMVVTLRTGGR